MTIPFLKFRYLKFETEQGWRILHARNQKELDNLIKKFKPLNVYHSLALFHEPLKAEKSSYKYHRKPFRCEFVLDFDSLEQEQIINGYKLMKKFGYGKPQRIVFTGGGFHLIFDIPNMDNRLAKAISNKLKRYGLKWDYMVSIDPENRVVRMQNTFNSNKGLYSKLLYNNTNAGEQLTAKMLKAMTAFNRPTNNIVRRRANQLKLPDSYAHHFITTMFKKRFVIYKKFYTKHSA